MCESLVELSGSGRGSQVVASISTINELVHEELAIRATQAFKPTASTLGIEVRQKMLGAGYPKLLLRRRICTKKQGLAYKSLKLQVLDLHSVARC